MATNVTKLKQDKIKEAVVENMVAARKLAEKMFGAECNAFAIREVNDYLEQADEEEFVGDLTEAIEASKQGYGTTKPEDVFDMFERLFIPDEK